MLVGAGHDRRSRTALLAAAAGVLAFAARLAPVLHGGGLKGLAGYDDGVYFGAADAVVSGRVPYRDFVLLHPPGLIYLLTPFAALGRVIGDADGWLVARLVMMAVGALSAVLAVLVARRFGAVAAVGAGLVYALWPPAINGETSTFLECVPNALLLLALLLLGSARTTAAATWRPPAVAAIVAGAALGLGASIKIWGVAPLAVVVGWQLLSAGWRRAALVFAGAVAAAGAVSLPTFVLDPSRMWLLVVSDQLQRSGVHTSLLVRMADFTPVHRLAPHASSALQLVLVVAVGLVASGAALLAWRRPAARVFVGLLVVQGAVLCGSPPYFTHYGAFLAPAVALTAGVGVQELASRLGSAVPRARRPVLAGLAALTVVALVPGAAHPLFTPYDGARIHRVLSDRRCVTADSPGALVLAGLLSRDLERGCPTRIDVSGVTYNVDSVRGPTGLSLPRVRDPLWQRDIIAYLQSGQAAIVTRSAADGFDRASLAALRRLPVLYRGPGVTVYGR